MKILLAVDGSEHSDRVTQYVIKLAQGCSSYTIYLLNVQEPVDSHQVRSHMPASEVEAMQESRGGDAMASPRALLAAAGISCHPEVAIGPVGTTIVNRAAELGCDAIVMGTHGANALTSALTGSVTADVIRHARCPVTVVR